MVLVRHSLLGQGPTYVSEQHKYTDGKTCEIQIEYNSLPCFPDETNCDPFFRFC